MIKLFAVFLCLSSTSLFAQEVVRMLDGHGFKCSEQYDVFRSQRQNVHLLENVTVKKSNENIKISADIVFVECQKSAGEFKFVRLKKKPTRMTYKTPTDNTVTRVDKVREVIAYNQNYSVVAKDDFSNQESGKVKINLTIPQNEIEANTFSRAQHRGTHYTTVMHRSKTEVTLNGRDLGSSLIGHGSFRIFFDL
ncbi:MAG: hypothetical protein CME65_13370 [Halobacteriovoraceae bacterium]|nr:hypothetical protein [Halobacteriovoraceae bacterium]|tara:strand:- start:24011 stop:24592 length:582 start_codon:yes stop_codon:yes gene_type:complete